ncbi:MAG: hypothetical protein KGQ59_00300 [Bdellovibrionales bacterium]|nr:hypothetical protein [Bdellovibrionales bacterium]
MRRSFVFFNAGLLALATSLGLLGSPFAQARVTIKNGNFYRAYTDIGYKMGAEPKIDRVYNSKTSHTGMFGPGWGQEYEVRLLVSADGSVVVQEYGAGASNRFTPKMANSAALESSINKIAELKKFSNKKAQEEYKQKLKGDPIYRNDEWQSLVNAGKMEPQQVSIGTQLFSNKFSYQVVTRTNTGYQRSFDTGKVETFDEKGRLTRTADKNGNFIEFSYSRDGKIEKIVDNLNRKMFLSYNSRGLLEKVQGEDGLEATYKYNALGQLEESRNADGEVHKYKYSTDDYTNLTEVGYSDGTSLKVVYYGADKYMNVKSLKERDGTLNEYDYIYDLKDQSHVITSVSAKGSDGKVFSQQKYEFFFKYKPDGEEWTYKLIADNDGEKTETIYNECCGLPLQIKRGSEETSFVYDTKGRVVKKTTPAEVTEITYDPKVAKVSKVVRNSKRDKKLSSWAQFQYDSRGNLVLAKNSDKKGVKIFYDASGRIKTLVDQDQRRLDFKYDQSSRPVEITDPKLGTIKVSWKSGGEIDKVDSAAGQKVAVQVTTAFQNLLEIIRPAGVSLTP